VHLWMWDEASIAEELRKTGISIGRCEFGDADEVMFAQLEDPGRFTDQSLNLRELAIELANRACIREELYCKLGTAGAMSPN
jgi:hypothetical protein